MLDPTSMFGLTIGTSRGRAAGGGTFINAFSPTIRKDYSQYSSIHINRSTVTSKMMSWGLQRLLVLFACLSWTIVQGRERREWTGA